jgi:hypothetical protein
LAIGRAKVISATYCAVVSGRFGHTLFACSSVLEVSHALWGGRSTPISNCAVDFCRFLRLRRPIKQASGRLF